MLLSFLSLLEGGGLSLIEFMGSFLSLGFQLLNDGLSLPTNFVAEIAQQAEFSEVLKSDDLQSSWDDLSLLGVIGAWDTFESLKSAKSCSTLGGLMGKHTSDGSPEDSGRRSVMGGTSSWVVNHLFSLEFRVLDLVSEEGARDVDSFSSDDNDSLTAEELLGDNGSQSTEEMALTIDNHELFKH